MPRSKVELFAATRQGSPFLPHPIDAESAKTSSGSSDQREDVSGPGCPRTSGCGRLTGEVWAGKILSPLDAENGFRAARSGGGQRAVGALLNPLTPCLQSGGAGLVERRSCLASREVAHPEPMNRAFVAAVSCCRFATVAGPECMGWLDATPTG